MSDKREIQEVSWRVLAQGMTPFQWSSAASSSLPAEVEASVARARLALECTQLAMLCMLRSAQRTGALTEAAAHAANLLLRLASKFVQCFALTPLPLPGSRRHAPSIVTMPPLIPAHVPKLL